MGRFVGATAATGSSRGSAAGSISSSRSPRVTAEARGGRSRPGAPTLTGQLGPAEAVSLAPRLPAGCARAGANSGYVGTGSLAITGGERPAVGAGTAGGLASGDPALLGTTAPGGDKTSADDAASGEVADDDTAGEAAETTTTDDVAVAGGGAF